MSQERLRVLVTGGAGFIGSHLVDALIAAGHEVSVIDARLAQVHSRSSFWHWPDYLNKNISHLEESVAENAYRMSAEPFDVVFHLAAAVGVGQAQYEPGWYCRMNVADTGDMLQNWVENPELRPGRLIVASSMSIYGEGDRYFGVSESARVDVPNQYAMTKYAQEVLCLNWGAAFSVPTVALRFFNVYGERQSLSNPYTGVAAMFAARLLNGQGGLVYEDGTQTRDFVHVSDIVRGLMLAMEAPAAQVAGHAINVGTGKPTSLLELHSLLAMGLGVNISPVVTGFRRCGDVRHCYADVKKARRLLSYSPTVDVCEGIERYAAWLKTQDVSQVYARVEAEAKNLQEKGLLN